MLTRLIPTDDDSGDAMLEIPEKIMTAFGWKIGDEIDVEVIGNGIRMHRPEGSEGDLK